MEVEISTKSKFGTFPGVIRLLFFLVLWAQVFGCTTTNSVRTIGKGNTALETTLGGPILTNLGFPMMTPNLYVGGRYGVLDDLDVSAHYNLTGPFIPGIGLNLILSGRWVPIQPGIRSQADTKDKGWSLATGLSLHSITDFQSGFVAIPVFDLAGGWRYKWFNPYIGVSLGLNFYRPFDRVHTPQINPYVGADFILNNRAGLCLRLTVYDVAYNLYGSGVEWVYLVDHKAEKKTYGAIGLSLGFSFSLVPAETKSENQEGSR